MKQIPNILSGLRIIMVGFFVYAFIKHDYVFALTVYVLAIATDMLDGYLARRNNWITDLGKILDPFADKLMLIAALYCFYVNRWIPLWLLVVVAGKELLMVLGGLILLKLDVVVYADWAGKLATGFFNVGVIATLLKRFMPWLEYVSITLLIIASGLAVIALMHYAKKNALPALKSRQGAKVGGRVE